MSLKLYMYEGSPPAISVLMTATALGIQIEKKIVDVTKGDIRAPEFLKMNPQHTIPTLVDGEFVLWESHCINSYLAEKYGKDDWLYPKNLEKRGTVNQRLHLNNSYLFPALNSVFSTAFERKSTSLPQEQLEEVLDIYELLNNLLEETRYFADDHVTVADFSITASMIASNIFAPIDEAKFPKFFAWEKRMKGLRCYQANVSGIETFRAMVQERLKK